MTPLQSRSMRTFATPALFAAAAWFAGTQRCIQYFPGATKNSLLCVAGLSSAGVVGSGMLFSDPASNQRRWICIAVGLVLSSLATHYGLKKTIPLETMLRFAAAEAAIVVATEVITSKSLQSRITKSKKSFSRNRTKNHMVRTFGVPVLFAVTAYFAGTERTIQYFPGATRKSLLCVAGLSSAGVVGSGMLLPDPASNQRRRICIAVGLVLSSLATHYGLKKTIPLEATLRFAAAEALIMVATEVITSKSLQGSLVEARDRFSGNRTKNHMARTFGIPVLFAVAAYFAGTERYIQYFPGATRKSLLCAAGFGGVGVMGSGLLLSDQASNQRRRIWIAVGLVLGSLATYYGLKKTIPLQTALLFVAAEALITVATEVITSESLQVRVAEARERFLRSQARSHAVRTFAPPALFAVAALFASMQSTIQYFPGATRKSLLCMAGLSGAGVVGSGIILSDQESERRRRICIAVGLVLSGLITHYGLKKTLPLQTALRFSAVEAAVVVVAEALTSGGPKFPTATIKSSLNRAVLSISVPIENPPPPNVAITFCVDTSTSMTGENRERDVKKGVSDVLERAVQVAQTVERAKIRIAVVGFSSSATTICEPMEITNRNVHQILKSVNGYRSNGGTDLNSGLVAAVEKVESMRRDATTHTLILLTDGEVNIAQEKVKEIHRRLAAVNAQLFVIGIGERHTKETLRALAPTTGDFKGTYIDTTEPDQTIIGAISSIYEQTMAVFNQLELRTSQLGAGQWSVGGHMSIKRDDHSVCVLGNMSEKTQKNRVIEIHPNAFSSRFDLSQLSFQLVFKDPEGKDGIVSMPWKANTVIDPSIIKAT